ncbi:hypothetical protein PGT21_013401 [Puccinia graminis f. sp. tritici]|uniref:Uncharacterized protein n=1 Tax=Puccinia graminis f. sp. tritici TaxID=56615 RepID=A0A5B0QMP8_PUCGR|nr:hypothetical protein PGT21_013401 [Puccinia graminis f. sp. tritici]
MYHDDNDPQEKIGWCSHPYTLVNIIGFPANQKFMGAAVAGSQLRVRSPDFCVSGQVTVATWDAHYQISAKLQKT